jgi:ADP-ribose pyrophosphatase YjhB (NUDIX family)
VLLGDDGILLARHRRPNGEYWVLPGGSVEAGELPEAAAVREVREETGLEIAVERLLFVDEPRTAAGIVISSPRHTFLAYITGGELCCVDEYGSGDPGKGYLAGSAWMPWESEAYDAATRDTLSRVRRSLGS